MSIVDEELAFYANKYKVAFHCLSKEKFFVTGASGLLGTATIQFLNRLGISVVGYSHSSKQSLEQALLSAKPTIILHYAAITSSKTMIEDPEAVLDVSIMTTKVILQYAERNYCKVVYSSSVEAYGLLNCNYKVDENALSIIDSSSIRSCYPIAKLTAEMYCKAYAKRHVNVSIVRLSSVFGLFHKKNDNRLYSQIVNCLLTSSNLVLTTTGKTKKSVIYTLDAVAAILAVAIFGRPEVYNITNASTYHSINVQAKLIFKALNSHCKVVHHLKAASSTGYLPEVKFLQSTKKYDEQFVIQPLRSLEKMFEIEMKRRQS